MCECVREKQKERERLGKGEVVKLTLERISDRGQNGAKRENLCV